MLFSSKQPSSNGIEKRPKLRFPKYNDSWHGIRFGDLIEEFSRRTKDEDEDILLSAAIEGMFLNTELFGHQRGASNKGYKKIGYGTLVLSTQNLHLGNANVNLRFEHGMVSPAYKTYRIKNCSVKLLAEWIKSEKAKQFFYDATTVGASVCRRNVEWETLYNQFLYLPSDNEQKHIADFLSLISEKIHKQELLIEDLKKYKRGLLDKLLEDNSTNSSWCIVKLQDVAEGFDYGMNSAATTYDGVHKYIRITDIDDDSRRYLSDDMVSPSETPEERYKVNEGDILFARTGASVGKSYLYDTEDGDLYFAGFLIRISVKKEFDSYFVYLNTLTSKYEKWLKLESMRSGQPGVNAEQYRNYAFRCPDYQTQLKIANTTKGIDFRIEKERKILTKLQSLKRGLLQQLFI